MWYRAYRADRPSTHRRPNDRLPPRRTRRRTLCPNEEPSVRMWSDFATVVPTCVPIGAWFGKAAPWGGAGKPNGGGSAMAGKGVSTDAALMAKTAQEIDGAVDRLTSMFNKLMDE